MRVVHSSHRKVQQISMVISALNISTRLWADRIEVRKEQEELFVGKVGDDEHKCCKSFAEHLPKQQEDEGGCSTRRGENGKELQVG